MVGTFEYLALLRDRMDDGLQRRSTVGDAETTGIDLGDHLGKARRIERKFLIRFSQRNQLR